MLIELIATFAAGFAAAGLVMVLNHLFRGRMPKWFMPVAAGAAMIVTTIANEYGWFPRTKASLPEGLEIAETVESKAFYRPWTYVKPFTERFVAVDVESIQHNSEQTGLRIVDVYFFGRWAPVNAIKAAVDCDLNRRAALDAGVSFGDDGSLAGVSWINVATTDPIVRTVCEVS